MSYVKDGWIDGCHLKIIEFHFFLLSTRILSAAGGLHQYPALKDDFEEMLSDGVDSPYLLSFLVDYYEEELENKGVNETSANRAKEVLLVDIFVFQMSCNLVEKN